MDIKEILSKNPEDRTDDEVKFLEDHKDEVDALSNESKSESTDEDHPIELAKEAIKKGVDMIIHKDFDVQIKALSNGRLEAVVNSGQKDRHGEILSISGLDIKRYMTNPILADGHDYRQPSVGRTVKLSKKDGQLIAEFEFATDIEGYDKPKILDALYRKGYQFAFSIGFIPKEIGNDGITYTKAEMIEFSPVLIGADAMALLKSKELLKSKGIDIDNSSRYDKSMSKKFDLLTILEKSADELTFAEVKFLRENADKISDEQKAKFAEIFQTSSVNTDSIAKMMDEKFDAFKKEIDPTVVKDINTKPVENNGKAKDYTKEEKFFYFVKGLQANNFTKYFDVIGKDAMTTSNTGEVLPPGEFIAEVERLEEAVGSVRKFVTLRRTTAKSITVVLGDDDLSIYDTAEAGVKRSTKIGYAQIEMTFRKYAGILPMTDELNEDSAIDLWQDATNRFARAFVRKEDEIVLTRESGSGNLYPGVLHALGVNEVLVDNIASITFDDLVDMVFGVPTPSAENGRFGFHRTLLPALMKIKNPTTGEYVWKQAVEQGAYATIWGRPYTLFEVMQDVTGEVEADTPIAFYGDLRYSTLGERTGIQLMIGKEGTVGDPDEEDQDANTLNLFTQDMQALRAVKRMNARVRFPEAFSVMKTVGASS